MPRWLENGRRLLSGSHTCSFVHSDLGSVGDKRVAATTYVDTSVIARTGSGRIVTPLHVTGVELK
ncbi:MAG: hypothetical protein QW324_06915 [Thermofilaceae archaeon]